MRMNRWVALASGLAFCCCAAPVFCAIEAREPDRANKKLGTLVQEIGEVALPELAAGLKGANKANEFRLYPLERGKLGFVVLQAERLLLLDGEASRVVAAVSLPGVKRVVKVPNLDDIFAVQEDGEALKTISRIDANSGKLLWTASLNLAKGADLNSMNVRMQVAPDLGFDLKRNQLHILGLELIKEKSSAGPKWRKFSIDLGSGAESGAAIYSYYRGIDKNSFLLLESCPGEFEVVNRDSFDTIVKGMVLAGDILIKPGNTPFLDVRDYDQSQIGLPKSDFFPFLTDRELLFASREIKGKFLSSKLTVERTLWSRYDLQGNRLGLLAPAPLVAGDVAVGEKSGLRWPLLFPSGLQGNLNDCDQLVSLDRNGSMTTLTYARPGAAKVFNYSSGLGHYRKGDLVYFCFGDAVYSLNVRENKLLTVYAPAIQKGNNLHASFAFLNEGYIDAWEEYPGNLTKAPKLIRDVLVHADSGQEFAPASDDEKLNSIVWKAWYFSNRKQKGLPREDLPPAYDEYYMPDTAAFPNQLVEVYPKELGSVSMGGYIRTYPEAALRIWGGLGDGDKRGDIAVAPIVMKDKSAILAGIRIPDNRVVFYLPLLRIKGLPDQDYYHGNYFPVMPIRQDADNAWLAVWEKFDSIRVYRIKRPQLSAEDLSQL